jgi:acyl-CoA dehydrogenase
MSETQTFRTATRAWLEANCPREMREPVCNDDDLCWGGRNPVFQSTAQRVWLERMAARGWTAPDWPREYGGGGLSPEEATVLRQEMLALGCRPPLSSFGLWMLGPALLKYATEAQKQEHLPKIVRGEIRWCQGYSEPNSGSDLASLQTRAEDQGDHFLVNGQKIWTSYADKADWMFCLVRTDLDAPKQRGISFVLFDMRTPGVSTQPIVLISGASPFCQTLLDNVRVPKTNLVGTLNRGWDVAKYLLSHEREMISGMGNFAGQLSIGAAAARRLGTDSGQLTDQLLRTQLALLDVDAAAFQSAAELFHEQLQVGQAQMERSSMLKYYGTELNKRRHELLMAAGGTDALEWDSERSGHGLAAREWLRSKGNSIEGGTSEIQLNIIAKRILNLPGN